MNVAKDPTPMKEPVYSTPDKTKMPMQGNSYGEQPSSGYPNQRLGSSSYSEREQAPRSSAPPVGQSVNLNAMLEDLDKNMTMQGVTIVPKGFCAACAKPIVGQVCKLTSFFPEIHHLHLHVTIITVNTCLLQ